MVHHAGVSAEAEVFEVLPNAAGLRFARPGFATRPDLDAAFAVGFPHLRAWSARDRVGSVAEVVGSPAFSVFWPKTIGRARARIRGLDNVAELAGGGLFPAQASQTAADVAPIAIDECRALIRSGLSRKEPFGQLEMMLLLEAELGAEAVLTTLVDEVERLSITDRQAFSPARAAFGQFVGFAALRVSSPTATALVDRLEIVWRESSVSRQPLTLVGALDRALHGRLGAERNGVFDEGALHPSSLWFVNDDSDFVARHVTMHKDPPLLFSGDARCCFVGGATVTEYFVRRWLAVAPEFGETMLLEFAEINDPVIVELMAMAGDQTAHLGLVTSWFERHKLTAIPTLRALAAGPRRRMAGTATRWLDHLESQSS